MESLKNAFLDFAVAKDAQTRRELLPDLADALALDDGEVEEVEAALAADGPGLVSRVLNAEIALPFFGRGGSSAG